ncbi:agrin-like isoform X2 [Sycon ciliatum]|uniref:agrin-like isoform X2 n=1 Tax=Sycon ciliatum TaxID=27933 RepID=UPI0031F657F3
MFSATFAVFLALKRPEECLLEVRSRRHSSEATRSFLSFIGSECELCREPCRPFQQCVADNGGGGQPRCGCETQCADSKNTNRQVCASNGETYSNKCEMRKAGCRLQRKLRAVSKGGCQPDPCSTAQCPRSQVCIPDPADVSRPKCICNHQCSSRINYVCGTNHRSYTSPCHLHKRACEEQTNVTVLHDGLCSLHPNPSGDDAQPTEESSGGGAAGFDCSQCSQYTYCDRAEQRCVCPRCHNVNPSPVCGTDANNYASACHLYQDACTNRRDTSLAYNGYCKDPIHEMPQLCRGVQCLYGGVCEVQGNQGVCTCPRNCPNYEDLTCGTDGKTYRNRCIMKQERCRRHSHIDVASDGACPTQAPSPPTITTTLIVDAATTRPATNPCTLVTCSADKKCIVDGAGQATCTCKTSCSHGAANVCGSDGETYLNECTLRAMACVQNRNITVVKHGSCASDPCSGVQCPYSSVCSSASGAAQCECPQHCPRASQPVCGSNGDVYHNRCIMQKLSCQLQQEITEVQMSACQPTVDMPEACRALNCRFHGRCIVSPATGLARCNCTRDCPVARQVVCGENGGLHIYQNECIMEKIACQLDEDIAVVPMERCTTAQTTPSPLLMETTATVVATDAATTNGPTSPSPPPTPTCMTCDEQLPLLVSFPRACSVQMIANGKVDFSSAVHIGEGITEYTVQVDRYLKTTKINGRNMAEKLIKIRLKSACTCASAAKNMLVAGEWVADSADTPFAGHLKVDVEGGTGMIEPYIKKPWKFWKGMYRYARGLRQIVCRDNSQ